MLITIPSVLSVEQVAEARKMLAAADWVDGRVTAEPFSSCLTVPADFRSTNSELTRMHPNFLSAVRMICCSLRLARMRHGFFIGRWGNLRLLREN